MSNHKKVLIVEDDFELRRMYETRLQKAGFDIVLAGDGEEAVQKALSEKPDFLILDLMLPKQGGIQVLRILKSHPLTKEMPVLVLTAYDHFNYRQHTQPYTLDFILKTETTPQKIAEMIDAYFATKENKS